MGQVPNLFHALGLNTIECGQVAVDYHLNTPKGYYHVFYWSDCQVVVAICDHIVAFCNNHSSLYLFFLCHFGFTKGTCDISIA